jgi:hypothetical protein
MNERNSSRVRQHEDAASGGYRAWCNRTFSHVPFCDTRTLKSYVRKCLELTLGEHGKGVQSSQLC